MVAHEVWVFADVDCLHRQTADALATLDVGVLVAGDADATCAGAGAVLAVDHFECYL